MKKEENKKFDKKRTENDNIEKIMKYEKKLYFYLPENTKYKINEDGVVLLDMIFTYAIDNLSKLILEKRTCTLKSPWREKLGWSVGNLYNRVALDEHKDSEIMKVKTKITT